jgi:hypothetical protein
MWFFIQIGNPRAQTQAPTHHIEPSRGPGGLGPGTDPPHRAAETQGRGPGSGTRRGAYFTVCGRGLYQGLWLTDENLNMVFIRI